MFHATVYDAHVILEGYATSGPGSIRFVQVGQAVERAQQIVLQEYDGKVYIMNKATEFDETSPRIQLSVVVPAGDDADRSYAEAVELFAAIVQEQLNHPQEKIITWLEKEALV